MDFPMDFGGCFVRTDNATEAHTLASLVNAAGPETRRSTAKLGLAAARAAVAW